jgi:hypothetical protein
METLAITCKALTFSSNVADFWQRDVVVVFWAWCMYSADLKLESKNLTQCSVYTVKCIVHNYGGGGDCVCHVLGLQPQIGRTLQAQNVMMRFVWWSDNTSSLVWHKTHVIRIFLFLFWCFTLTFNIFLRQYYNIWVWRIFPTVMGKVFVL